MTWCGNQPLRSFTQPDCSSLSSQSHFKKGVAFLTRASQSARGTWAIFCTTLTVIVSDINSNLSTGTPSVKLLCKDRVTFDAAALPLLTQDDRANPKLFPLPAQNRRTVRT